MKNKLSGRGFALIAVLAVVTLLMLLLGALIGTNQTAFSLLRGSQAAERSRRTIDSAVAYCRAQLEQDYRWGKAFSSERQGTWGDLQWKELASSPTDKVVVLKGRDRANQTDFQVEICNNVLDNGEVAVLKDVQDEGKKRLEVPAGFCQLKVSVGSGGRFQGANILVRNPGLIGAAAIASELIDIEAHEFDLRTMDPIKNQVRSLKNSSWAGSLGFLEGKPSTARIAADENLHDPNISQSDPVVWSAGAAGFRDFGQDMTDEKDRMGFKQSHLDLDFKEERFIDDAKSLFDIPDVGFDDVTASVRVSADKDGRTEESIPPGLYRFEQIGYEGGRFRVLTKRPAGGEDIGHVGSRPVEKFWWTYEPDSGETPPSAASLEGSLRGLLGAGGPSAQSTMYDLGMRDSQKYVSINSSASGGSGHAQVDLLNRRVVLDDQYTFKVAGDFSLIGSAPKTDENDKGDDDLRQVNPAVYFGDATAVGEAGDFTGVGKAANATLKSANSSGVLMAEGRLHIQGDITGKGVVLAAGGDLSLEPGRLSGSEGDTSADFSLFSDRSISIKPPPILEDIDSRASNLDGTIDAAGKSKAINVSEHSINLTGLIYAKDNVVIDLQDTKTNKPSLWGNDMEGGKKSLPYRKLRLEGAVVARTGKISVRHAQLLRLIYNPQYVDQLLPRDKLTSRCRFEVTSWREMPVSGFLAERF